MFPDPNNPGIKVPATPNRPPIPYAYNWLAWPITNPVTNPPSILEAVPEPNMGGWGSETAGMLSGYIQGKSYGLFGPSADVVVNGAVTVNSASQGILAVREEMNPPTSA